MTLALVVDDLEENRYFLETLLSAQGWRVQTAQDGEEALAKARASLPDIVISDLLMPVMDGFTLLRHWKTDVRLKAVPFVVYTASYVEPEDECLARNLGADAFIIKPAEPDVLLAHLRSILARGAPASGRSDPAQEDEATLLRGYSEALIRKLEKKSLQLEESNRALQRDIAERMRVEDSLRLLDSVVTQSGEAVLITDARLEAPGPHIVFVNDAFLSMTGYAADEVIGKSPRILQGPKTDRDVLDRLRDALMQGKAFEGEAINYRKDRSEYLQKWRIAPILDADGRIGHYVATLRDITESRRTEDALQDSRRRLDGIVSSAMDAIISVDSDRYILLTNAAAETMFGYAAEEMKGQRLDGLMPTRFHAAHTRHFQSFGQVGITSRRMGSLQAVLGRRKNGEEFPIEASISRYHSGGRQFFTAILRDITERARSEARIRSLDRVRDVMAGINSLIVRVKTREELFREACAIAIGTGGFCAGWIGLIADARISVPLSAWCGEATAYRGHVEAILSDEASARTSMASSLVSASPIVVNDIASDDRVTLREAALASGFRSLVVLPLCIGGKPVALFTLYSAQAGLFDEDEMKLLTQMADDLSLALDHIQKTETLDFLACYDPLTGLANRSLFLDRVTQYMHSATAGGRKLALVLTDLERFRSVNDTFGRAVGDALIKHVSAWMARMIGDANLLARIDADHFALVLPDVESEEAVARYLEQSRKDFLDDPFLVDGFELRVVSKVGLAVFPEDGADAETLFNHAEAALKKAKESGERYVFYTQKMTDIVAGKLALESRLVHALENEEFVLHYQPKVDLPSHRITGVEALIRWNDPSGGLVPPAEFIPMLEETGLIHQVGKWALLKALQDVKHWRRLGAEAMRVAVNVSSMQLRDPEFVADVERIIEASGGTAGDLELEITESMIMEDIAHGIATLNALRALGVTVAIDDFGTGYSSLGYLSKLPIDTLKIDRTFINGMTESSEGLALVTTIIALAHALKMKVVAEGVEVAEQSTLLRQLGCDEMQGYLFCRPVPCDQLQAMFPKNESLQPSF